jgi:selenocysteine-specific translation elongation factor
MIYKLILKFISFRTISRIYHQFKSIVDDREREFQASLKKQAARDIHDFVMKQHHLFIEQAAKANQECWLLALVPLDSSAKTPPGVSLERLRSVQAPKNSWEK